MQALGYLRRLARSMFAVHGSRRSGASFAPAPAALTVLAAAAFYMPGTRPVEDSTDDGHLEIGELRERVVQVSETFGAVEAHYEREIGPIERVLRSYRDDEVLTRRIALSLAREAKQVALEPRLLLAVLLVENPWLNPDTVSAAGAKGLMQVMPVHEGKWSDCAPTIESVEDDICYGARIFAHYLEAESGNIDRALLRYNGCVHGTNTPDCHLYPTRVYARAGRASVLAWARSDDGEDM